MQLVLEFQSGPYAVPLIWLTEGQVAIVGRTELANFSVAGDRLISGRHFSIACARTQSSIQDLHSTNGTFVNGRRVRESTLQHGDTIRAGDTTFVVRLVEASTSRTQPSMAPAAPSVAVPSVAASSVAASSVAAPSVAAPSVAASSVAPPSVAPPTADEYIQLAEDELEPEIIDDDRSVAANVFSAADQPSSLIAPTVEMMIPPHLRLEAENSLSRPIACVWLETLGASTFERIWMSPGHSIVVGRAETADYCLMRDEAMSGQHFQVACGHDDVRIRDLDSRGGTFVNDQPIKETRLLNHDRVEAGETAFRVKVVHADSPEVARRANWPACSSTRCLGGVVRYQARQPQPASLEVVRQLAERLPLYALINYPALGGEAPPNPVYLQNWLPASRMNWEASIVLPAASSADVWTEIERAWAHDVLLCVFARLETPRLLQHLRSLARGQTRPNGAPNAQWSVGCCRPTRLTDILVSGNSAFARYVFDGIDAILIESQVDAPWEIFATSTFVETLDELGITVPPACAPPSGTNVR